MSIKLHFLVLFLVMFFEEQSIFAFEKADRFDSQNIPTKREAGSCSDKFSFFNDTYNKSDSPEFCQRLKSSPAVYKRYPDKTQLPNYEKLGEDRELMLSSPSNEQVRQIKDVFDIYKNKYIDIVQTQFPNGSLKETLIERLRKLKMRVNKNQNDCLEPINANYEMESNELVICPTTANMPIESLYLIIGHELAHVIDYCNEELAMLPPSLIHKIKKRDPSAVNCVKGNQSVKNVTYYSLVSKIDNGAIGIENRDESSKDLILLLKDCGVEIQKSLDISQIEKYPLKEIHDCSTSDLPNEERQKIETEKRNWKKNPAWNFRQDKECSLKVKESFADKMAAETTKSLLAEQKISLRDSQKENFLYPWFSEGCFSRNYVQTKRPSYNLRLSYFLSEPEFQKMYNCQGYYLKNSCEKVHLKTKSIPGSDVWDEDHKARKGPSGVK